MIARIAKTKDVPAIVNIYNQGIDDRIATFETRRRTVAGVKKWLDGPHPVIVVEENGKILGFAVTFPYSARECYAGVAEFSVYVAREARGRGVGRMAMQKLLAEAENVGFWKLLSRVFPENAPSLGLLRSLGFREVGVYRNHAQLDGAWRDVVIVEYLIRENLS